MTPKQELAGNLIWTTILKRRDEAKEALITAECNVEQSKVRHQIFTKYHPDNDSSSHDCYRQSLEKVLDECRRKFEQWELAVSMVRDWLYAKKELTP